MKAKTHISLVGYLVYLSLILHSIASGLSLVPLTTVLYFNILPPMPRTLIVFYIGVGAITLLVGMMIYYLFKRGQGFIAVWMIGAAIIFMGFGVPIFMVENNHMLWHQDPFGEGPDNLIDFSPGEVRFLKYMYLTIYIPILKELFIPAIIYIFCYLGVVLYLWRRRRTRETPC